MGSQQGLLESHDFSAVLMEGEGLSWGPGRLQSAAKGLSEAVV